MDDVAREYAQGHRRPLGGYADLTTGLFAAVGLRLAFPAVEQ